MGPGAWKQVGGQVLLQRRGHWWIEGGGSTRNRCSSVVTTGRLEVTSADRDRGLEEAAKRMGWS